MLELLLCFPIQIREVVCKVTLTVIVVGERLATQEAAEMIATLRQTIKTLEVVVVVILVLEEKVEIPGMLICRWEVMEE